MFKYDPKDATSCLPEGEAQLVLVKVEEKQSKAGNDMAVLTFDAFSGERRGRVTEYVVNPTTLFKLKQIAKAFGPKASAEFDAGKFDPSDYVEESLMAVLKVESQDGFDDKNVVKKYLPKTAGDVTKPTAPKATAPDADDSCPW